MSPVHHRRKRRGLLEFLQSLVDAKMLIPLVVALGGLGGVVRNTDRIDKQEVKVVTQSSSFTARQAHLENKLVRLEEQVAEQDDMLVALRGEVRKLRFRARRSVAETPAPEDTSLVGPPLPAEEPKRGILGTLWSVIRSPFH